MGAFTAEQLAERKNFIGASEVAAALGLSRYTSRLELYLKKTTDLQSEGTPATRFGTLLESHVLDEFGKLVAPARMLTSNPQPQYGDGILRCHLDGWMDVDGAVVEAKTARTRDGWGAPGTDDFPQDYILQTQTQMHLTGYRLAYVPVLFRDSLALEVYQSVYDEELVEMIVKGVAEFWDYVQRGEPPRPDWDSPAVLEIVRKVYPGTSGEILTASEHQETLYRALCDAKEREAGAGKAADGLQSLLLWDMAEAAELRFSDGKMLRRKKVTKKGYTVEPFTYTDARIVARKEGE